MSNDTSPVKVDLEYVFALLLRDYLPHSSVTELVEKCKKKRTLSPELLAMGESLANRVPFDVDLSLVPTEDLEEALSERYDRFAAAISPEIRRRLNYEGLSVLSEVAPVNFVSIKNGPWAPGEEIPDLLGTRLARKPKETMMDFAKRYGTFVVGQLRKQKIGETS